MVEIPTAAGFAEPVPRRVAHPQRGAGRSRRGEDSAGLAIIFLLLISGLIPSTLVDFNVHLLAASLLRAGGQTRSGQPGIAAASRPLRFAVDVICASPVIADSAASVFDGVPLHADSARLHGQAAECEIFLFLPGGRNPRAPPA